MVTADGALSAHWEHTIAITDDGPEILTLPDGRSAESAVPPERPGRVGASGPLGR